MKRVTYEDIRSLTYFWQEYEDITRWIGWEDCRPDLEAEHPEVVEAWIKYRDARHAMTAAINNLRSDEA